MVSIKLSEITSTVHSVIFAHWFFSHFYACKWFHPISIIIDTLFSTAI